MTIDHSVLECVHRGNFVDQDQLLDTISMTKQLRAEAQQTLFLHNLVNAYGNLTDKGNFVSNLDCETEYGCLLWIAHEYHVLPDALTIFAIWAGNPTFVSNEFKKLLRRPAHDVQCVECSCVASTLNARYGKRKKYQQPGSGKDEIATASTVKFAPSLVIRPSRTVRDFFGSAVKA